VHLCGFVGFLAAASFGGACIHVIAGQFAGEVDYFLERGGSDGWGDTSGNVTWLLISFAISALTLVMGARRMLTLSLLTAGGILVANALNVLLDGQYWSWGGDPFNAAGLLPIPASLALLALDLARSVRHRPMAPSPV
jgi:hypothetical protein